MSATTRYSLAALLLVAACGQPEIDSRQTVTVAIVNESGADRFVLQDGGGCDPFRVTDESGAWVPVSMGFQCVCECNPPQRRKFLRRVSAGEQLAIVWDARSLVTWSTPKSCGGEWIENIVHGALQPIAEGKYAMTIFVDSALPNSCVRLDQGLFNCSNSSSPGTCSTTDSTEVAFAVVGNENTSATVTLK